jgi:hypothetical protein
MSKGDPEFRVSSMTVKKTRVTFNEKHIEEALRKAYKLKGDVEFFWNCGQVTTVDVTVTEVTETE